MKGGLFGAAIVVEILFCAPLLTSPKGRNWMHKKDWNGKRGDEIFSIEN